MLQGTKGLYGYLTKSKLHRRGEGQDPYNFEAFTTNDCCEVNVLTIVGSINHPFIFVFWFPFSNSICMVIDGNRLKNFSTVGACHSIAEEVCFSLFLHQFSFGQRGLVSSYAEHTTSRRKISREFRKGPAAPSSSSCWGCGGSQGRNPGLADTDTNLLNQQELTVSGWTHPCRVRIPASPMARNGTSRERPVLSLSGIGHFGELAERSKAPVLKTGGRRVPGVRIPHSP